ncbi:MAG: MBL fold metallo-hydrolase [Candidatus Sericytochromatia bacterium]|nr:MBL fold metallo-hydrolase [Candidatus Sericytochromatia bacterium]
MSGFSVVPLGVGDAFSALYYSSCLLLEAEGVRMLIDCPHPIRKMLREAAPDVDINEISGVALTHLHADHSSGLEGFGYYAYFTLGRKAHLVIHPAVSERLWSAHLAAGMEQMMEVPGHPPHHMGFDDYFALTALDKTKPVSVGPFTFECRRTIHPVPTTAMRITAAGRTLGYSADTAYDPALIEWLSSADLILHETNIGIHTPYERLAELPAELRARMRLIHYPDEFDLAASVIQPVRQGVGFTV